MDERKRLIELASQDRGALQHFLVSVANALVSNPEFDEEVALRAADLIVEAVTEFNIRQRYSHP